MLIQYTVFFAVSWILWRTLRQSLLKSPLRNLSGPPSASWLKGNLGQIFSLRAVTFQHEMVRKYGGAVKFYGMAGDEQVYFSDPRALHNILVKDEHIFEETSIYISLGRMVFGDGLLSTLGDHHKKQRKMLNPVFSIDHMRNLTPLFYEITHKSLDVLAGTVGSSGTKTIDMLDAMSRTALEFIGQGGLGHSFDVLDEGKKTPYTESVRNLIPVAFPTICYTLRPTLSRMRIVLMVLPFLEKLGPAAFRRFLVDISPFKSVQQVKRIVDIMERTSIDILANKRSALAEGDEAVLKQVGQGKDIMSILLRANATASKEDRLPEKEILGQMSSLIFAAHDTTSSAISRILHMLCLHPDVQDKLRQEVTEARAAHGDLPYDEVSALPYLDAVCRETLRLHAPVPIASRTARKNTVVPLLRPVKGIDGTLIHEVPIAEGQDVTIGLVTANCDLEIWGPDAAEWKPERWLNPLPESVSEAHLPGVYSGMMTFLGGARACIGFKFSQLEMKIILSMLLERFSFVLPDEEIVWKFGHIQTPSFKGKEDETPHLPLKVSVV